MAGFSLLILTLMPVPLVVFAGFGVLALLIALYLKAVDKKRGYGLEEPNIKN